LRRSSVAVEHSDRHPLARQPARDLTANATAATSDQSEPPVQRIHI
jgi:hypothetical protein